MRRLNNRGFAITTLLYGLMSVAFLIVTILMGVMSQNRQNTSNLVHKIEDNLNRFGETETVFQYTGESSPYYVPYGQAGWYKIELWGAATGSSKGSYTSGLIYLDESEVIYVYVGGTSYNYGNSEIRLENGLYNDMSSKYSTIMRAGGSGENYISGHSGSNTLNISGSKTDVVNHSSNKYFIKGMSYPNANNGNGKVNIKLVYQNDSRYTFPTLKNPKLDAVRYVKVCQNGNTVNGGNHLVEVQAIDRETGKNILKGKLDLNRESGNTRVSYATDGVVKASDWYEYATNCAVFDAGGTYNLSEVGVWAYFDNHRSYKDYTVSVSTNGSSYRMIKDYHSGTDMIETSIGQHFSAWDIDTTTAIPDGNYYIFSAGGETQVVTAEDTSSNPSKDANASISNFMASNLQKWNVERVDINTTTLSADEKTAAAGKILYKIVETENKNALQVENTTGEMGENISAHAPYVGNKWDLWEIIPERNGTYKLVNLYGQYLTADNNGYDQAADLRGNSDISASAEQTDFTRRFKFMNAEY